MKKVLSFVLAVALVASLAVCASADALHPYSTDFIAHNYDKDEPGVICEFENWLAATFGIYLISGSEDLVRVDSIVGVEIGAKPSCETAITAIDMAAAVEAWNAANDKDHQIAHMTVFKQRALSAVESEDPAELTITLWPCGKKNSTVLLVKYEDAETWEIVEMAEKGEKQATIPAEKLANATDFVVCMTW